MGYVERNLLPEEQVLYSTRLHWLVYAMPIAIMLVGVAVFVALTREVDPKTAAIAGAIPFALGVAIWLARWIRVRASEFAVTSKRVVVKLGVVRRRTLELLLRQVEAIEVEQTFMGRILGYGTITIVGTGGTKEPFHRIAGPLEFRRQVQSASGA
jgi:uncharacterized membrane protein YdbT with pleckstrin-like domain